MKPAGLRLALASLIGIVMVAASGVASGEGRLVDVVEYYHATLDHYFMSSLADDIEALDAGKLPGWVRTGHRFYAYSGEAPNAAPVCRFYLPPEDGDSHFYSASPAECADIKAKFPSFRFESASVMYVGLPDALTGACLFPWTPVYRLWNRRADSNHRHTTDLATRAEMLARGYVAEGYGPEGIAMCAPPVPVIFGPTPRFQRY